MSFIFQCPYCKHRLSVIDEWEGVQTQCPHCNHDVTIHRAPDLQPTHDENSLAEPQTPQGNAPSQNAILLYAGLVLLLILVIGGNLFLAKQPRHPAIAPPADVVVDTPAPEEPTPQEESLFTASETTAPTSQEATAANNTPANNAPTPEANPTASGEGDSAFPEARRPQFNLLKRYDLLKTAVEKNQLNEAQELANTDIQPLLMVACRRGDADITGFLLDSGADPANGGQADYTPITLAASTGHLECLKMLLQDRKLVNRTDRNGYSPLYYAVNADRLDTVEYLCSIGANPNILHDDKRWTPLTAAIQKGLPKMVKLLLKHEADLNLTTQENIPVIRMAIESGNAAILDAILWRNRRLNFHFSDGLTPLLIAIHGGNSHIVKLMLDYGANPNLANQAGDLTPIALSHQENNLEITELLLKYGAIQQPSQEENKERPQDIISRLKANVRQDPTPSTTTDKGLDGRFHLGDIAFGEKFRGNLKLVSNTQNKNLPPAYELTQPQKKYGVFVIHPSTATYRSHHDHLLPPEMDHSLTVMFTQKSLLNWGFIMSSEKGYHPLDFSQSLMTLLQENFDSKPEENQIQDLMTSLEENDAGHLHDFITAATQDYSNDSKSEIPWNDTQVYRNGNFLAVLYTHPYKRFSESVTIRRKTRLYLIYIDLELYQKACSELAPTARE